MCRQTGRRLNHQYGCTPIYYGQVQGKQTAEVYCMERPLGHYHPTGLSIGRVYQHISNSNTIVFSRRQIPNRERQQQLPDRRAPSHRVLLNEGCACGTPGVPQCRRTGDGKRESYRLLVAISSARGADPSINQTRSGSSGSDSGTERLLRASQEH